MEATEILYEEHEGGGGFTLSGINYIRHELSNGSKRVCSLVEKHVQGSKPYLAIVAHKPNANLGLAIVKHVSETPATKAEQLYAELFEEQTG